MTRTITKEEFIKKFPDGVLDGWVVMPCDCGGCEGWKTVQDVPEERRLRRGRERPPPDAKNPPKEITLDVRDFPLDKDVVVKVTLTHVRELRFRLWFGSKLIKLGAWIARIGYEEDSEACCGGDCK